MIEKNLIKKVRTKWIIRLPADDKIKLTVKKGDQVAKGETLATIENREVFYIDLVGVMKSWSSEKINQWKNETVGKIFEEGSVVIESGGLFPKKIVTDRKGVMVEIDEFGRAKFASLTGDSKTIKSPVEAVVNKIEDGKIVLAFEAAELKGEGNNKGKTWADLEMKLIEDATLLKSNEKNKIIFLKKVDQVKLSKAEVIGVSGMVLVTDEKINWDDFVCDLPMLLISQKKFEELDNLKMDRNVRVMLNSNSGRFLVVVQ